MNAIEYKSHMERCAQDIQYRSNMERYMNDVEYESHVERCAKDVQHESKPKYLAYLTVDMTKSCIENEGLKIDGTPRGQERAQECYPSKPPAL